MQYHGNKTLYQRVFKGIECMQSWKYHGNKTLQHHGNKTLNQRVFKGIERNIMERRL